MQKLSLAFLAVAFASPITLAAQLATPAYDSTYFTGLEWRNIGPNRGGRSIGVALRV